MKHTAPLSLVLLTLVGGGTGWMAEIALAATGRPTIVPPATLSLVLIALGIIVVMLALPVRRSVSGKPGARRVDPFYAMRVAVLAKSSSLSGALIAGFAAGVLVFVISRPVVAEASPVVLCAITLVGAIALMAGGIVGERLCTVPPGDDDDAGEPPAAPHLS